VNIDLAQPFFSNPGLNQASSISAFYTLEESSRSLVEEAFKKNGGGQEKRLT